jgi:protein-disulfide isomerase
MKNNKIFTTVLIVIFGVLLGLAILAKQSRSPFYKAMYEQQVAMLKGQEKLAQDVKEILVIAEDDEADENGEYGGEERLYDIEQKQRRLESRISMLERQIRTILQKGTAQKQAAQKPQPPKEDPDQVYEIPVAHSPVIGNKDAPITLVEFVDIQCPYCKKFHFPLIEAAQAFPDKVKVVIKHFPLRMHPQAKPAAKAALAANEQGKYLEMVNLLLQNSRQLGEAKYYELAEQLGLDMDKFKKDLETKDAQYEQYIQADMALAKKVNVRGTPTMFLNGKKTRARDVAAYKKEIKALLKK